MIQIEKFAEDHAANTGEFLDHHTRYRLSIATRWGNPMRRPRFTYMIALLLLAPLAGSVPVAAKKPALKVPIPVAAERDAIPVPEHKPSAAEAKKILAKQKNSKPLAKELFGAKTTAAALAPRAIGWYAKGCLAGGVHLSDAGSAWQTMRPSRNRAWGHPKLIRLVKRLGTEAKKYDGWPGLLIGDIAQPRGGPMISGHASHQVGLDADIWLTPMPDRILTTKEREDIEATSMLDETSLAVDPKVFTDKQVALIKRAASYRRSSASSCIPPSRRRCARRPARTAGGSPRCARCGGTTTISTSASAVPMAAAAISHPCLATTGAERKSTTG